MSQGCIFLTSPLFVVQELKGDLYLFTRDSAFLDVSKNKQILLSVSKPCLPWHCTYIQLVRDRSPGPRELPAKTDERMGKKKVISFSFSFMCMYMYMYVYVCIYMCARLCVCIYIWKQWTEKIGHLPKTGRKACKYEFKLNLSHVSIWCHKPIIFPKTAY